MTRPGEICHTEIPAPDIEKARSFYGSVFGWRFQEMAPGYLLFGSGSSGGALSADLPVAQGGPRLYVEVESIEEALGRIARHGGVVTQGKTEIGGGHGYYANFEDPNGNQFGVHSV